MSGSVSRPALLALSVLQSCSHPQHPALILTREGGTSRAGCGTQHPRGDRGRERCARVPCGVASGAGQQPDSIPATRFRLQRHRTCAGSGTEFSAQSRTFTINSDFGILLAKPDTGGAIFDRGPAAADERFGGHLIRGDAHLLRPMAQDPATRVDGIRRVGPAVGASDAPEQALQRWQASRELLWAIGASTDDRKEPDPARGKGHRPVQRDHALGAAVTPGTRPSGVALTDAQKPRRSCDLMSQNTNE